MITKSNLAEAILLLERCTDDEIRQIQAVIAVRLKETPIVNGGRPSGGKGGPSGSGSAGKPARGKASSSKKKGGNPQKKSQYATHPLYKAYKDARAAMTAVCKKDKVSFGSVTGETRDKYDEALTRWVEAKSGFRGHGPQKKPEATEGSSKPDQRSARERTHPVEQIEEIPQDEQMGDGSGSEPSEASNNRSYATVAANAPLTVTVRGAGTAAQSAARSREADEFAIVERKPKRRRSRSKRRKSGGSTAPPPSR